MNGYKSPVFDNGFFYMIVGGKGTMYYGYKDNIKFEG